MFIEFEEMLQVKKSLTGFRLEALKLIAKKNVPFDLWSYDRDEDDVVKFEDKIGMKLDPTYRKFLLRYRDFSVFDLSFAPLDLNPLADDTLFIRKKYADAELDYPYADCYCIFEMVDDCGAVIQNSKTGEVLLIDPFNDLLMKPEKLADNIVDYMYKKLKELDEQLDTFSEDYFE